MRRPLYSDWQVLKSRFRRIPGSQTRSKGWKMKPSKDSESCFVNEGGDLQKERCNKWGEENLWQGGFLTRRTWEKKKKFSSHGLIKYPKEGNSCKRKSPEKKAKSV